MTITPFLALKLRRKKDAIVARTRARRVGSLLGYDVAEQACIAAGAFVIACQALELFGQARLVFQIVNHQLQIYAEGEAVETPAEPASHRLSGLFAEPDTKWLYHLTKPLPAQEASAEEIELGWLVRKVEELACDSVFDEIVKQNQEILALLHELRLCRPAAVPKEEKSSNPHAA
ncbi:MAG: hypothetical protein FJ303_21575 [Planctomycetes bacterium]|nr:hypothetical protein [Planctomycetota bacterium]